MSRDQIFLTLTPFFVLQATKRWMRAWDRDYIEAHLSSNQRCYVAGAFDGAITDTAWFVQGNNTAQPGPALICNTEETHTRIWLHVKQSRANKILIKSPDTDVYHIGLPLECISRKQVVIQISPINSRELCLLSITVLVDAMQRDPDLAVITPSILPQVLQTLYVVSGCDYTSFFRGIGKVTFIRYFCQHAPFITGCQPNTQGTLADTSLDDKGHKLWFWRFYVWYGRLLKEACDGF